MELCANWTIQEQQQKHFSSVLLSTISKQSKIRYRRRLQPLCPSSDIEQETQLSLTNLCDVFIGQSRSPNIVPFHMVDIVSYCAIVTLSFNRRHLYDIPLQKCCDLEIGVRGHSRSLKVAQFDRFCMVSYQCPLVTLSLKHAVFEIFDFKNAVTLKTGFGVRQGHLKCHHVIECISTSLKVLPFGRSCMVSYQCSLVTMSLKHRF